MVDRHSCNCEQDKDVNDPSNLNFSTARTLLVDRWPRNLAYDSLLPVYIKPEDPTIYVVLSGAVFNEWATAWVCVPCHGSVSKVDEPGTVRSKCKFCFVYL